MCVRRAISVGCLRYQSKCSSKGPVVNAAIVMDIIRNMNAQIIRKCLLSTAKIFASDELFSFFSVQRVREVKVVVVSA